MSDSESRDGSVPTALESERLPAAAASGVDRRVIEVWCTFLDRMATDAEAALAAAIAYGALDGPSRDVWVRALQQDVNEIRVPKIAVYAPLLAVESDPERRQRITRAIGPADRKATPSSVAYGLCGEAAGVRVAAVVSPLYLDFVQVLACSYASSSGFEWVKHDPIVERDRAPRPGGMVQGTRLDAIPLKALVDDLALAVLAHQRSGKVLPDALRVFADLFGPAPAGPDDPPIE